MAENVESNVSLELPAQWQQVPVDPDAYAAWLRETIAGPEITAEDKTRIETSLRSLLVEARGEGLVLGASYLGLVERDEPGTPPMMLAANAFVTVRPAGELQGVLSSMAWQVALREADRAGDVQLLKPTEVVMLGDIEAVKCLAIESRPTDDGGPPLQQLTSTYYATVADGGATLILGFRTPCTWLSSAFESLFDDIAATLRFDWPTDLETG